VKGGTLQPPSPLHFKEIMKGCTCLWFCSPCHVCHFSLLLYFALYSCYVSVAGHCVLMRGKQCRYERTSRELKGELAALCFFQVWLLFWKAMLICLTSVCTDQIWDLLYCPETNFHFVCASDSLPSGMDSFTWALLDFDLASLDIEILLD